MTFSTKNSTIATRVEQKSLLTIVRNDATRTVQKRGKRALSKDQNWCFEVCSVKNVKQKMG